MNRSVIMRLAPFAFDWPECFRKGRHLQFQSAGGPCSTDGGTCDAAVPAGVLGLEGAEVTAFRAEPSDVEWRGSMADGVLSDNGVTEVSSAHDSPFTFERAAPAPEPLPN